MTSRNEADPALHPYAAQVLADLQERAPWETEFLQAVTELLESVSPVLRSTTVYERKQVLERLVEPDQVMAFRISWTDDGGRVRVNRGYRVQFSNALGPYKGGTRFHPSVNLSTLKLLGFEQVFKNALTSLPLGGGKGGADFQPRGRSDAEIMRFCQAYVTALHHHIGADVDVPAGDIGVGTREIGFLFGQYRRLRNTFDGAFTGKAVSWGGSHLRPEATGHGVAYFAREVLRAHGEDLAGKRVAVSGFGNVAWGAVKKVTELGGRVVTLSGPDGFVHDPDGVNEERVDFMSAMRAGPRDEVRQYAERFGVPFHAGKRPWGVPCDVAMPCAIQNELDGDDARRLVEGGCRFVIEGANMPTTRAGMHVLSEGGVVFVPGKAANAGGVAVSGLEMVQNSGMETWEPERVSATLQRIVAEIHRTCVDAADRYGRPGDYVLGANIGGFLRVADAVIEQGVL